MNMLAQFGLVTFLVALVLAPRILAIHFDLPMGKEQPEHDYR